MIQESGILSWNDNLKWEKANKFRLKFYTEFHTHPLPLTKLKIYP